MKKLFVLIASLAVAASVRAALPQPDLIAQIHFAGGQKISADANVAAFTNEFCSAEALTLRKATADKLAPWLAGWLQKNYNVNVPGGSQLLRPLFDDLQSAEWFAEARAGSDGKPDVAIAIKLDAAREKLWRANIAPFFQSATKHAVFKSANGWLYFETGFDAPKLADKLAARISTPSAGWLAVDLNWPRLAQWFPKLKELGLPETQLVLTADKTDMHIDGKFLFPENLALTLEPWRVPTNTLHQPFVSLSAVRGFSSWLRTQSWAQSYQLSPTPNQAFVWALAGVPFQTFAAVPVPNAASALQQSYAQLKPQLESGGLNGFRTAYSLELTNNQMTLGGVPFIGPFMEAKTEGAGQFLFAGAFPNTPRSKPLPPELFTRLGEPNLVFYHWEITAERMPQVLNLCQLFLVLKSLKQIETDSPGLKWMEQITPKLGNTITEIKQSGPAEMTFMRKAPGGFTAVEFFALVSWLGADNFPGWNIKMPPPPANPKRPRPHAQTPQVISIPNPAH